MKSIIIILLLCLLFWKGKRRLALCLFFILSLLSWVSNLTDPTHPDNIVKKFEQYTKIHNRYPESLESMGVRLEPCWAHLCDSYYYQIKEKTFELCYFTMFDANAMCFDPMTRQWHTKDGEPDLLPSKEEIITKLEQYKNMKKRYPDSLDSIGVNDRIELDDGFRFYSYQIKGETFELCQNHYEDRHGAETSRDCFDPLTNQWALRQCCKAGTVNQCLPTACWPPSRLEPR